MEEDKDIKDDLNTANDNQKYMVNMMRTIAERGKYWYTFSEYEFIWIMSRFCCCFFKNKKWYKDRLKRLERHEDASQKLADEIDIVKLLYVQRVGQFIAKLILKKHQRALVTSFRKYQLDDLGQKSSDKTADESSTLLHQPSIQDENLQSLSQLDVYMQN